MCKTIKQFILSTMVTGIILLVGCTSVTTINQPPATNEPITLQPVTSSADSTADNATVTTPLPDVQPISPMTNPTAQKTATTENRVDVIYFHLNQRCVTCLCFEQHVNHVIETYFNDAITSGKLTYRVLNAQEPQNIDIAKKYGAVGSQLFINTVVNGFDNIEDIQDIWNWNCRNNPGGFELKVKDVIENSLNGKR